MVHFLSVDVPDFQIKTSKGLLYYNFLIAKRVLFLPVDVPDFQIKTRADYFPGYFWEIMHLCDELQSFCTWIVPISPIKFDSKPKEKS